ncbi:MAG: V-type ATP synthase subunit I [Candidatus Hadarchaeales archaeon]
MRKVRLVFLKSDSGGVIGALHDAGVVQLKEISEPGLDRMTISEKFDEISSLLSRFREMEAVVGGDGSKPLPVTDRGLSGSLEIARKLEGKVGPEISALKEKIGALERKKAELNARLDAARKITEVGVELKYLRPTKRVWVAVGNVAEESLEELRRDLDSALSERVIFQDFGHGRRRLVLIVCLASDREKISPLLYRHEVELLDIPEGEAPPAELAREIEKTLRETELLRKEIDRKIGRLAKSYGRRISAVRELLEIQRERLEAHRLFAGTEHTVVMEGWVPEKNLDTVERIAAEASGGRYVLVSYDPSEEELEAVPSRLDNRGPIRNFEYITKMYGPPKYSEVDPTPVLSFTFPIFFAIALSDAGYGLLLGIFMASGVWIARAFPADLRRIMIISGACTVVAGILFGGCFGLIPGLWVNPIERPIPLLKLSIFIGIAHLLLGIGLTGALRDAFARNWRNIVFDRISKVLLLVGFFGLGFCVLGIGLQEFGINFAFPKVGLFEAFNPVSPAPLTVNVFRLMLYSGLALGVAGALIGGTGARGKIGGAINSIYGITGLIADVTSYCRLLALCIASGVIAFSINFILGFMWGGVAPSEINPLTAIYLCVLAVVFGLMFFIAHSFNIFLNSLGAFVHTLRLHFAEFFSKFYEGGGEEFKPFKAKRIFTRVAGGKSLAW